MVSKFFILKLLVIKNVKSHLIMWYIMLLELLIAIIFTILLINLNRFFVQKSEFSRHSDDVLKYKENSMNLSTIKHVRNMSSENFWGVDFTLAYTPKGGWQQDLAYAVGKSLQLSVKYVPPKKFDSYLMKHNTFCGLLFNTSSYRLPKYLNYSLVFPAHIRSEMPTTDSDYKSEDLFWKTRESDVGFHQKVRKEDDLDVYYREGFLSVQNTIFQMYLKLLYDQYFEEKLLDTEFTEFPINMQQMHYPKHSDVISIIQPGTFWVEVIFFVSYMLPTMYLTYFISKEYESMNHVFLKGYGVNMVLHWIAHILVAFLRLQVLNCVVILVTHINWGSYQTGESLYHGDDNTDFFVMYIMLMVFNLALVMFSFLMAIIIEGQIKSIMLSFVVNLFFRSMYIIIQETSNHVPYWARAILHLMYTNVLSDSILFLNEMEVRNMPLKWSNIMYGYTWIYHITMLMICFIVYGFLIWFYQEILPGPYLQARNWNFICMFSSSKMIHDRDFSGPPLRSEFVEFGPYGRKECIVLKKVCKYVDGKMVLSNLSFKAYEGEITVLLGHKQSGQGIAINIMSGLITPSSGTILVYGQDNNTSYSKSQIALCPPINCFFECLSAEEYLEFIIKLKGLGVVERKKQIEKWAGVCAFDLKRRIYTLSYDEKRILSLVSCMVGKTKIITMYDPTSKMSPSFRQKFWNIMRDNLEGRSFIVATNSIEEATIIGNRIGILLRGELTCYGTQFFLKKRFAEGYRLSMILEKKAEPHVITSFLRGYIPSTVIEHNIGVNLTYLVPQKAVRGLPLILGKLHAYRANLKIKSFGVMGRSLEEVFLGVENKRSPQIFKKPSESLLGNIEMLKGKKLKKSRMHAMAFKRICDYRPSNFPLAVMLWALFFFIIIAKLEQNQNTSVTWNQISKNASFKHHLIHAYLEASIEGDTIPLYRNFNVDFTKSISTNLQALCQDCSLTLQSWQSFFEKMPYPFNKEISEQFLTKREAETYSYVSFSYDRPTVPTEATKMVDPRILEKITNKQTKRLTVYFTMQSPHLSYRALNLAHNLVLMWVSFFFRIKNKTFFFRSLLGQGIGIACNNNPLPMSVMDQVDFMDDSRFDFGIIYIIGTCIPFLIAYFAYLVVRERSSQFKKLQHISGISIKMYWALNASWDYATYIIYILVFSISFLAIRVKGFDSTEILITFGFLVYYGIGGIAFVYVLSYLFRDNQFAFITTTVINLVLGVFNFDLIARLLKYHLKMKLLFMIFPQFAVIDAIHLVFRQGYIRNLCQEASVLYNRNQTWLCQQEYLCCDDMKWSNFLSFTRDGIFWHIMSLGISPIVYYVILFTIEYIYEVKRINRFRSKIYPLKGEEKDKSYKREKQRIRQLTWVEKNDYRVVVDQLEGEMKHSSFFPTVSFTLEEGHILGIIGLPNAGRRELCYKIAGLSRYTYGDVFIEGHDLRNFKRHDLDHLSFGFHQGGFIKGMSIRNLLCIVCMCRGVPKKLIRPLIKEIMECLCLHDDMGSSFSINRRISTALALIANINIMILDEPTTRLDPLSREIIWQTLLFARKLGKTIIFSASSFYEGEVLADRILFHVDGGVYGLGPIQELKTRVTKAICVEIQLIQDGRSTKELIENYEFDLTNLLKFMEYLSPHYKTLKSLSSGILAFYLPFEDLNWAKLLDIFEKQKDRLRIIEYCFEDFSVRDIMYPSGNV
ncbi:ABCA3.2 family protein [Megaselia abdita]